MGLRDTALDFRVAGFRVGTLEGEKPRERMPKNQSAAQERVGLAFRSIDVNRAALFQSDQSFHPVGLCRLPGLSGSPCTAFQARAPQ